MKLMGIDPGLNITGYACVECDQGSEPPRLLEAGVIRMPKTTDLPVRLGHLFEELESLLSEFSPGRLVVESIFSHKRFQGSGLLMGHARGVILLAAQRRGIPTGELAPAEVKKALTGNGTRDEKSDPAGGDVAVRAGGNPLATRCGGCDCNRPWRGTPRTPR